MTGGKTALKKKDNTWVCSECGTVNGEEFDICFSCGATRRHIQEPAAAPKKQRKIKPAGQTGRTSGKGKLKPVLIVAAAVVVVFLAFSLIVHVSAQSLADAGNYAAAAEKAKLDLLFSSGIKERALIDKGIELYKEGKYKEAVKYLEPFADDETAKKYLDMANMSLAFEDCERGKYDSAIERIESIDESRLDITQLKNEAYFGKGLECLKAAEIPEAHDCFEKVVDDAAAADYLEITNELLSGEYLAASKLASQYEGYDDGLLTMSEWDTVFDTVLESAPRDTIEQLFQIHGAKRMLHDDRDLSEEEPSYAYYYRPYNQKFDADPENHTRISKEDLERCGSSSDGKIIVLWEIHEYDTGEVTYYIDWSTMQDIPKALYPESLEEVGRAVRIECYGEKEGWYNNDIYGTIDAVREFSYVYAGNGYDGKGAYSSAKLWGAPCPSTIFGGNGGNTVFGGINDEANGNDISVYIYKAIRKLVV